jgi:hypothetical protein
LPLSFFRRKKSEDLAQLTRAPERPEVEPLTVEAPAVPASSDGQSTTAPPKKPGILDNAPAFAEPE